MRYYEEKTFSGWFFISFFVVTTIVLILGEWITHINSNQLYVYRPLFYVLWLIMLFFVITFWKYRVKIIGDKLIFGFGIFKKIIQIKDIYKIEEVNINSKRYYNYGIYRKKKEKKLIYSSGNGSALHITVRNKRNTYVLSTQNQNQLLNILNKH